MTPPFARKPSGTPAGGEFATKSGSAPVSVLTKPASAKAPTFDELEAVAAKIADGSALSGADVETMKAAVLAATGRSEPKWSAADFGITDPDVHLSVADGCADGSVLACSDCACVFRPYEAGRAVYPDRFVTAKDSVSAFEPAVDPGHSTAGVCAANADCGCHQAAYRIDRS